MAIRVTADDAQSDAAPTTDEPLVLEECVIVRWRGYTRSTFVACLADGTPVAESKSFKWRDGAAPHDGAPGDALAALCRELEALGWTRTGEGDEWFAVRHGRFVAAPEPEAEPEDELEPVDDEPAEEAPVARELPPPLPVQIVREPEPLPAPPPPPAPTAEPVRHVAPPGPEPARPRRRRSIVLVSVLGILAAIGLGAYIVERGQAAPTRTVQLVSIAPAKHRAPAVKPSVATTAGAPVPAAKPTAARPMRLVVANTGHASWLEVRRGSSAGPVLYSGILEPGQTIGYSGRTLWVRFAAAANFHVTVGGRPVALQGTVDRVFSAKR